MARTTKTPQDHATTAADAVRAFNHTISGGLRYPGDAYTVVAEFKQLAYSLEHALGQLARTLDKLHDSGRLTADCGTVDEHVLEAQGALVRAVQASTVLGYALDTTHSALGPLGYDEH